MNRLSPRRKRVPRSSFRSSVLRQGGRDGESHWVRSVLLLELGQDERMLGESSVGTIALFRNRPMCPLQGIDHPFYANNRDISPTE